jgi:hypothetical protein
LTRSATLLKVAVDANFLIALRDPKLSEDDRTRLDHLIAMIERSRGQLIVPMPALAEFLVGADRAGLEYVNKLERRAWVDLAPFDRAAAFECAQLDRAALGGAALAAKKGQDAIAGKKDGVQAQWQKIKIDRQLVAIAKSRGANQFISADDGVRSNAQRVGIRAMTIPELELPDSSRQSKFSFDPQATGPATGEQQGERNPA